MKVVVLSASLALALSAAPVFAQAASGQARPAQPRPAAPATSSPVAPAPAQAVPPPPPATPVPFPAGAKVAYVNLQAIANQSAEGKSLTAKVQALMQKKQGEAAAKQKALADAQQKLQQSGALMSEQARTALEKDIERMNLEGQRFQQDAQSEINELSQQLQNEFQQKLFPILDSLVKEHELHLLLSAADAGIVAGNAGIDLTMEAVRKLDERTLAGAAKPAAPAAAVAPAAK
ncbi:MAG TPA: OmpH family outer membrane protein [Vicinamibacterales bacterium]|nr:OmpH family outer membrane protein [Vicinamibacterales bacterium]